MSLILTRRIGESIIIEGDISVKIVGIKGKQVRLAIDAPRDISVHRNEIQRKIDDENAGYNITEL